jgi:hypothetical protein
MTSSYQFARLALRIAIIYQTVGAKPATRPVG